MKHCYAGESEPGKSLALHNILDGYRLSDSLISSTDLEFFSVVLIWLFSR